MATELLQNLIPNANSQIQTNNQPTQIGEKDIANGFSKLFDSAQAKYNFKEHITHNENVANSHKPTNKSTILEKAQSVKDVTKTTKNHSSSKIEEHSKDFNTTESENKTSLNTEKINNTNTTNTTNSTDNTEIKETIKAETDATSKNATAKTDTSNELTQEVETDSKTTVEVTDNNNIKFSENVLNNILLGKVTKESESEENDALSTTNTENKEIISNIEDTLLDVVSTTQTNTELDINEQIQQEVNTQTDILKDEISLDIDNLTSKFEDNNLIDKNALTIKSNDTLDTLKQFDKTSKDVISTINNENLLSEDLVQEIENLENEVMVNVEDAIDLAMDDVVKDIDKTSTKETANTKISQDVIDELDVTVRSVVSTDTKTQGGNTSNFNNQKGNAQENIIKMSLEQQTQQGKTFISEPTSFDNVLTETVQIKTPEINLGNAANNLNNTSLNNLSSQILMPSTTQTQISDTEILTQINNKLTLPQDNVTNKINIILQPEQLGKVAVEIVQTKDGIVAKMVADTVQVKELLDKSIESLKNTLANQGVNVNNITVKVEESTGAQNSNFGFEQEQFNREAANQSNQQKQSSNSEYSKESNSANSNNAESTTNEEIEPNEIIAEKQTYNTNENGSISIMV